MATSQLSVDSGRNKLSCVHDFTWDEMHRTLVKGWGELGSRIAHTWDEFNRAYSSAFAIVHIEERRGALSA